MLKLVLAFFDIGTVLLLPGLLIKVRQPPAWVLLHAWHPLIVGEVVARGHLDSVGIFFLVLAMRLLLPTSGLASSRLAAGASLAASVLAKGYALFTFPFLLLAARPRQAWFAVGFVTAGVIAYLPFASAGIELWQGISLYAARWHGYTAIYEVVDFLMARFTSNHMLNARRICAVLFALWLSCLWFRMRKEENQLSVLDTCFLSLAGFFLLSPVLYPWYLAWTVPFLCLRCRPVWLLFTGSAFFYYAHHFALGRQEIPWVKLAEYGPPLVLTLALLVVRKHGLLSRGAIIRIKRTDFEHEGNL
ncbi:MAG: hypothetical protein GTO55_03000 [Armatimonadetes bacterium]|nr:hypothetical protein [Armatimonadota bacterium]NIM23244.1 hypothetical protein [Armatimonadota bacterium]NIM67112.1 hypothetical protein [Armatimonadota bacterium]NIM75639.1 hypothetical protein [Armatimonadota bacterium]NIN05301.1 hypothetical protein [Armatimonadota bacterium]